MTRDEYLKILAPYGWSGEALDLGLQADFCCEYCDRDLLGTIYDYDAWQTDHILPLALNGQDHPSNHGLSCKTCNFIKRHSLPPAGINPVQDRKSAILAIRAMLKERQERKQHALDQARRLFRPEGWSRKPA